MQWRCCKDLFEGGVARAEDAVVDRAKNNGRDMNGVDCALSGMPAVVPANLGLLDGVAGPAP